MVKDCSPAMRCTDVSCFAFLFINYKDSDNEIIRSYVHLKNVAQQTALKKQKLEQCGNTKTIGSKHIQDI